MAKRSKRRHSQNNKDQQNRPMTIGVLVVATLIVIGGAFLLLSNNDAEPGDLGAESIDARTLQESQDTESVESEISETKFDRNLVDPVLGSPDAKVTIIEYGAYGCPSCRQFHQLGIIERILQDYDGQVNFVFRDFPVISPEYDRRAAQVAQCALDQSNEGFWDFHDTLYRYARPGESTEALIGWATSVGLDETALTECMENKTHEETVQFDQERALSLGLPGTPSFLVNDQRIFSLSEEAIRQAIETALSS